jgi:hypothetical protein
MEIFVLTRVTGSSMGKIRVQRLCHLNGTSKVESIDLNQYFKAIKNIMEKYFATDRPSPRLWPGRHYTSHSRRRPSTGSGRYGGTGRVGAIFNLEVIGFA